MPEMTVTVRWPDGAVEQCWSPSLVLWDHLAVGADYPVDEFVRRTAAGLAEAGERVRERYGFLCTSAAEQSARIVARGSALDPQAVVRVLAMAPPLPVRA